MGRSSWKRRHYRWSRLPLRRIAFPVDAIDETLLPHDLDAVLQALAEPFSDPKRSLVLRVDEPPSRRKRSGKPTLQK